MGWEQIWANYKWVIIFYSFIILMVYTFRKNFEFHGKIVAMYRTKFGLKLIEKIGTKHSELIKLLGYCGIGIGFTGMLVIVVMLLKGFVDLMLVPNAPPVVSPVLPGIPIPGSPVHVPLIEGWIALFVVVLIHEFAHGIVAQAHGIKVQSTGIVFFGPLLGAFVEPDEKQVDKKSDVVKYSIFAAGPFSNVILAAVAILIAGVFFSPLIGHFAKAEGIVFTNIEPNYPAQIAGLEKDVVYTFVNGNEIKSLNDFEKSLETVKVGENIVIGNSLNNYTITTTSRSENPEKAVIGVNVRTKFTNEETPWMIGLLWVNGLITWIFILSLGLGLANLLPIGPVDGGRMIKEAFEKINGKKQGAGIWMKLTIFMIVLLLILLIVPIVKSFFI